MRSARLFVPVLLASVLLTGCFTGKRGHFVDDTTAAAAAAGAPLADAAMQAVVAKLEAPSAGQFTADYDIVVKFGNTPATAKVAETAPDNQSITIGHVRYLTQGQGQTCELSTGACVTGLQDQQISDLQLTHNFFSESAALKLRQDATTMVDAAIGSTKQIAGQNATCVEVHFAAGNKSYCVLDSGLLARQDTPDVRIELTTFTVGVDTALFTAQGPADSTTTTVAG